MVSEPDSTPVIPSSRFTRSAPICVALLGLLLGIWPNLVCWVRGGDIEFIPDSDGMLYLAWSRDVMVEGAWNLTDAVQDPSGPMMHPWVLFVPIAQFARWLGLDLGLTWRAVSGPSLALGLYTAIRPFLRTPIATALAATVLLANAGFAFGQPLRLELEDLWSLLRGDVSLFANIPRLMPHFRVPTPAFPIALLLLFVGRLAEARKTENSRGWVLPGLIFGALFYAYFFYWTAAGLALLMAMLLDRKGRALFFHVGLLGTVLGAPSLLLGMNAKRVTPADWLLRTEKFVPIGRFAELLIPRLLMLEWLTSTWFAFRVRPETIFLWCLTASGLICANHQVLTGLQIENFHWITAFGVAFSLLLTGLIAPLVERRSEHSRLLRWVVYGLVCATVLVAFLFRTLETTRCRESIRMTGIARAWRAAAPSFPADSVVAGDPDPVFYGATRSRIYPLYCRLLDYSSRTTDTELDERLCLNWYLLGRSRDWAEQAIQDPPGTWTQEALVKRSPQRVEQVRRKRRRLVEQIWADPIPWVERYRVRYIALPAGNDPPRELASQLRSMRDQGPVDRWRFWEILHAVNRRH